MGWIPESFKKNPFIVWGFLVVTVTIFVYLFGKDNVLDMIQWGIGMPETEVIEGAGR